MELVLVDFEFLIALSIETTQSPEDFLLEIESRLESGDLTYEEAHDMIREFNQRSS